jgi:hypothetical protein
MLGRYLPNALTSNAALARANQGLGNLVSDISPQDNDMSAGDSTGTGAGRGLGSEHRGSCTAGMIERRGCPACPRLRRHDDALRLSRDAPLIKTTAAR